MVLYLGKRQYWRPLPLFRWWFSSQVNLKVMGDFCKNSDMQILHKEYNFFTRGVKEAIYFKVEQTQLQCIVLHSVLTECSAEELQDQELISSSPWLSAKTCLSVAAGSLIIKPILKPRLRSRTQQVACGSCAVEQCGCSVTAHAMTFIPWVHYLADQDLISTQPFLPFYLDWSLFLPCVWSFPYLSSTSIFFQGCILSWQTCWYVLLPGIKDPRLCLPSS